VLRSAERDLDRDRTQLEREQKRIVIIFRYLKIINEFNLINSIGD
jgi:hypothetical protein